MSNVENANTPTPALATGAVSEASTPTRVNGMAPATRRHRHPGSHVTLAGTASCRHTTDSSSAVRATDQTSPAVAQSGTAEPAGSLHTANVPGTPTNRNGVAGKPPGGPSNSTAGCGVSFTDNLNTSGRA